MTIIATSFRPPSSARRPDETVDEGAPVDPTDLVTLDELAGEGVGSTA